MSFYTKYTLCSYNRNETEAGKYINVKALKALENRKGKAETATSSTEEIPEKKRILSDQSSELFRAMKRSKLGITDKRKEFTGW